MATAANSGEPAGRVTQKQIVHLGAAISINDMEPIAEGYMDIEPETVKNLRDENRGKAEAFNRAIIRYWINKHPENQVKVGLVLSKFSFHYNHRVLHMSHEEIPIS